MPAAPGGPNAALQAALLRRDASRAARADAERAASALCAARDAARVQVAAALAARSAPLCVPSDLWRVALPGGDAAPSGGDALAAAAAGRPSPAELWGAGVEGGAARERLTHLLRLCEQVHEAEGGVAALSQRVEAAALQRARAELTRALRGAASPPPPRHTAEAALRDWHAACLAPAAQEAPPSAAAGLADDQPCFDVRWSDATAAAPLARVAWSTRRGGVVARLACAAPPGAPLNALRLESALEGVAAAAPFWLATRGDPAQFTQQVVWPAMDARASRVRAAADALSTAKREPLAA